MKKILLIYLIVSMIFVLMNQFLSKELDKGIQTTYEYSWGDASFKDVQNRADWGSTKDINSITLKKDSIMWFRFQLPKQIPHMNECTLFVSEIYENYEVYEDGKLIYSFGDKNFKFNGWNLNLIPLSSNSAGKILYIKVYSNYHRIGLKGVVKVDDKSNLIKYILKKDVLKLIIPFLMILIGFFFLVLALYQNTNSYYFFFAVFLLVYQNVFIARTYIKLLIYNNPLFWLDLRLLSLYIVPVLFTIFIEKFLGMYKKVLRIIWISHLIFFIFVLLTRLLRIYNVQQFYSLYDKILFASMVTISFIAILSARNHKDNKILAFGFVTYMVTGIYDVFVTLNILPYQDYSVAQYGLFVLILCILTIHAKRYVDVYRNLELYSKELTIKNEELMRLNKIKDEFLANTSHELRTPLNGIIGLTQSLVDDVGDSTRRTLEIIIQNGKKLNNLINDILDFNKAKNNELTIEKNMFNLKQTVENIFLLLTPIKKQHIEFINGVEEYLIYADENRIQQVLNNLIGNALKFTENGFVKVYTSFEEGQIKIVIEDSGIGISKEELNLIFDEFYQVDSSTSKKNGGTGLGLSISKKIIELHDGKILVESILGKGTSFICIFPTIIIKNDEKLAIAVIENKHPDKVEIEIYPEEATILIVDDEEINLNVIRSFLGKIKQWNLFFTSNGEEALKLAEKIYPDIILLDVMMPVLDGFEVCKRLRATAPVEDLKIIFLTAKCMDEAQRAYDVGANEYLTKPIERNELINRINAHIQSRWFMRKEHQQVFTERQIEFLKLAFENPNDFKETIANKMFANIETIKKDIKKINELLNTKNFSRAAIIAKKRNII